MTRLRGQGIRDSTGKGYSRMDLSGDHVADPTTRTGIALSTVQADDDEDDE